MKTTIRFKRYIRNNPLQCKDLHFYYDGEKHWWLNGKRHREDGPAIEWADGTKEWWLKNIQFRSEKSMLESHRKIQEEPN